MNEKTMKQIVADSVNYREVERTIALIDLLEPCLKRNMKRRYRTKHGDKTELGLCRTLQSFFEEYV